jgi:NADPH-dependent curcumin reductase CurA
MIVTSSGLPQAGRTVVCVRTGKAARVERSSSPPRGATVLVTGTSDDTDRLRGVGATTVIDYTAGPVAHQVRTAYPDGVDALINLAGFTTADVPC